MESLEQVHARRRRFLLGLLFRGTMPAVRFFWVWVPSWFSRIIWIWVGHPIMGCPLRMNWVGGRAGLDQSISSASSF